jgi:hypothetical protein
MRCHHIIDPESGKILIPGCMGAAVYGSRRCTCYNRKTARDFEKEEFNKILKEKEDAIESLEYSLKIANDTIEKLIQEYDPHHRRNRKNPV